MSTITMSDINRSRGNARKAKLPPIDTAPFVEATFNQLGAGGPDSQGWTRIVLPYPPSANAAYPNSPKRGRYLSAHGKIYKRAVATICLAIRLRPLTGRVHVLVDLYRPQKSGDVDNFVKVVFDSLKPDAWHDDAQIKGFGVNQHEDPAHPRAVVAIRLVGGETLNFSEFLSGRTP